MKKIWLKNKNKVHRKCTWDYKRKKKNYEVSFWRNKNFITDKKKKKN